MKIRNQFRSMYIVPWFPGVVFCSEILPFYQVPQFPVHHPTVQDFLYHPLLFSINNFRGWWRRGVASDYGIWGCRCQLDHTEDRVEPLHRLR